MNYDLKARLWQRDSTQEWVLELSGTINDTTFVTRHAEPLTTTPEDAVGLPSLYAAIAALEAGRSSGDPWPTIRARLELAIEHGDAHGWYTARNELLGVIGSDYAAAPQQPTGRSGEASWNNTFRADAKRYAEIMRPEAKAMPGTVFASVVDLLDDIAKLPDPFPQQPPPVGVTDALKGITRYSFPYNGTARDRHCKPTPNGRWVTFDDVVAALSRQQQEGHS